MNYPRQRRLFFALSADAPWDEKEPSSKALSFDQRHLTLAFLGTIQPDLEREILENLPLPYFKSAPLGLATELVFLPGAKPRVVAHKLDFPFERETIFDYQKTLRLFLEKRGITFSYDHFLPHVTLGRAPYDEKKWTESFTPIPYVFSQFCLYESLGNRTFKKLWQHSFDPVFEEFEHTADIAYRLSANSIEQLFFSAVLALSMRYPPYFAYFKQQSCEDFDQLVRNLNTMIAKCDGEIGCPFKAVSYHGTFSKTAPYHWEMIVDV